MHRYRLFIVLLLMLPGHYLRGQVTMQAGYDISQVNLVTLVNKQIAVGYIDKKASLAESYGSLHLEDTLPKGFVPNKLVTKKGVVRFPIRNTADTMKWVWFFPGFYCWEVQLYKVTPNGLIPLPSIAPSGPDSISFRKISLAPH